VIGRHYNLPRGPASLVIMKLPYQIANATIRQSVLLIGAALTLAGCKRGLEGEIYATDRNGGAIQIADAVVFLKPATTEVQEQLEGVCTQYAARDSTLTGRLGPYNIKEQQNADLATLTKRAAVTDSLDMMYRDARRALERILRENAIEGRSGSDGHFVLENLPSGKAYVGALAYVNGEGTLWLTVVDVGKDAKVRLSGVERQPLETRCPSVISKVRESL
jgi:hypothetical protein